MDTGLQILLGCAVGWGIVALVVLVCGRKMTIVHGSVGVQRAGFFKAVFYLARDYFFGYSNTLWVKDGATVKVHQEEREFRKNRPPKSVMVFEVYL